MAAAAASEPPAPPPPPPPLASAARGYAAAALTASLAEAATYPLDVLKTRLQLQGAAQGAAAAPLRLLPLARALVAREGARALFAGLPAAVARQWLNAGVSVGAYPAARRLLLAPGEAAADAPLYKRAAAGAATGSLAQALAQPLDVVKVRLQADGRARAAGAAPRYRGAAGALAAIARAEGARGLYVALGSSVWRAAIINAVGIATYDATKQWAAGALGGDYAPQVVAALVCGVASTIVSCPLDVVKTRVINDPARFRGPGDALAQLIRADGVAALWKGVVPTYQRQFLFNGIFWLALEEVQKVFGLERI